MNSIYLLNETYSNGYRVETLDILSFIAILCGILVIISKNPIVSVLFLIGLFLSIASYLIILGLNFIGLSYLLVYVGAVSILFLFILMLINVRISELLNDTSNSIPLAIFISILFIYTLNVISPYSHVTFFNYISNIINKTYNFLGSFLKINGMDLNNGQIYLVTSKVWDGNLSETSHITTIGNILYTSYSIWLIITSIILLLAMVGAIVITIKQKNTSAENNISNNIFN